MKPLLLATVLMTTVALVTVGCSSGAEEPTPTPKPILDQVIERASEMTFEDARSMIEDSMDIIESGELDGLDAATGEALCQVAEGTFEPLLALDDIIEGTLTRLAVRGFCGLR